MNANQKQNVINVIDSFKGINIPELFVQQFGKESKAEETSIGDYTLSEFYSLTIRMFVQLEKRINLPLIWQMLPASQNFQNDFGACDLHSYCSSLVSCINNKQYDQAISYLKALIYYQIANGFWESLPIVDIEVREQSLNELKLRTKLILQDAENQRDNINVLQEEVDTLKVSLTSLTDEKSAQFEDITSNLTLSQDYLSKIVNTLNEAIGYNASIKELENKCANEFKEIENKQKAIIETEEAITKQQSDSKLELIRITDEARTKLTNITHDYEYVEGKKDKVKEMMGYIADGTLSHSFNKRKLDIKSSVKWWGIGSIVCGVLMGAWIFIVFKYLHTTTGNDIANMIINVAKTSPMVALFWFALAQYQKERNLLEEYAFREAIAVTLTAYLDQLEGEQDEHKRALLINTVERLYAKPRISSEGVGLFSFKSKDLVDLVKEVKETLVEVKLKK